MDALQLLRADHRKVKELFRQFEEAEGKAEKQAIAETVFVELDIHSVLEEEVFYPAVRRHGNGAGELVERAEQEHHLVDSLMAELMEMDPGNMEFDAKFHNLIENVKSHIDEEEVEMLPVAAEVGLSRLEQLGERMAQRRSELLSEGQDRRQSAQTRAAPRAASRGTSTKHSRSTTSPATAGGATARRSASSTTRSDGAKLSARSRTVAQAGSRKRTTQTRSKISGRRSGSQSGS